MGGYAFKYHCSINVQSCCFSLLVLREVQCLDLIASISQRGIKGEIKFSSKGSGAEGGAAVLATADLEVAPGVEGDYTWAIYEFPIDYTKVRF